jgi:hypothetical protein
MLKKDRYLNPEPVKPRPVEAAAPQAPAPAKLGLLGEKLMGALTQKEN